MQLLFVVLSVKKTHKTSGINHKIVTIPGSSLEKNNVNKKKSLCYILYQKQAST